MKPSKHQNHEPLFQETQRPLRLWVRGLIIGFFTWLVILIVYRNWEDPAAMTLGQFIPIVLCTLIILLLLLFELTIHITSDYCEYKVHPFITYKWCWKDLQSFQVVPVTKARKFFMGKYTRDGVFYGWHDVYGLQIKHNGRQTVLGVKQEEKLRSCIAYIKNKYGINHG